MLAVPLIVQILSTLCASSIALYIVLQPNPVLAVFSLIGLALVTAIRWGAYGAFFPGLLLLLIYLGAVLVLFLFVVMTLSQQHAFPALSRKKSIHVQCAFFVTSIALLGSFRYEDLSYSNLSNPVVLDALMTNSEVLMQFIGLFLLLAMLVAVILLKKSHHKKDLS